ncbi:CgeB family protein [Wenyingzhuangia sp. IMCC45574]
MSGGKEGIKVLSIGGFSAYGNSNTCLHRHKAITKCSVSTNEVDTTANVSLIYKVCNKLFNMGLPIKLPDLANANKKIISFVNQNKYDVVWIDKGITIEKSTLKKIKEKLPKCSIVGFSPDNMMMRFNQSQNYLECASLYDYTFTTKSHIVKDLKRVGFKNVNFINKTYHEDFHFPRELTIEEKDKLGGDVGFIGTWEQERCDSILFLVNNGIRVKVFGNKKWRDYKNYHPNLEVYDGLFSDDYPKALRAFKISLCFLRKINADQQTARTMEIPACGGFMLAERTDEHKRLFEEGKEAEFFDSNEELLNKCKFYLEHENERNSVVKLGRERCESSGYSNMKTIKRMLEKVHN